MAAYILAMIEITDPVKYVEYTKRTPAAIAAYGGRFVVRGGSVETLEGEKETRRVVLVEFPTKERAQAFYDSAEYRAAREIRLASAKGTLLLLEGFRPPEVSD